MKLVKSHLHLKSLLIGFFACAAIIVFSSFSSPTEGEQGRYQTAGGDEATIVIDTHSGNFIYKENLATWSSGTFEDVFKHARPAVRKK